MEGAVHRLDNSVRRSLEQTERWEKAWVLLLKTDEQHHGVRPDSPQEFFDTFVAANKAINDILGSAERLIATGRVSLDQVKRASRVQEALEEAKVQKRIASLMDAPFADPWSLYRPLSKHHPEGLFTTPKPSPRRAEFVDEIRKSLLRPSRDHFFSISDSHRTTADMFEAARTGGWKYRSETTALLSFDHHTDTYEVPFSGPRKANVMRWLLEENYIRHLGVVGTQPVGPSELLRNATFIEGDSFYRKDGTPSYEKLEAHLHRLFTPGILGC